MSRKKRILRNCLLIGAGIIGIAIIIMIITFIEKKKNISPSDAETVIDEIVADELDKQQSLEEIPEELEPYMTINLFPGFSGEAADEVLEGTLSNSEVLLEYAGSYDGIFYEDGGSQEKENVFSLIVTNVSENTLEVMQLWVEDENGTSYQFQVSALPSGGTVLVQELEGKEFQEDLTYRVVTDTFGFMESQIWLDDLAVEENDGVITVKNNGSAATGPIQLIYKNWMGTYVYIGGIAYRISLDNLEPGQALQITADHYTSNASRITGIKQLAELKGAINETAND